MFANAAADAERLSAAINKARNEERVAARQQLKQVVTEAVARTEERCVSECRAALEEQRSGLEAATSLAVQETKLCEQMVFETIAVEIRHAEADIAKLLEDVEMQQSLSLSGAASSLAEALCTSKSLVHEIASAEGLATDLHRVTQQQQLRLDATQYALSEAAGAACKIEVLRLEVAATENSLTCAMESVKQQERALVAEQHAAAELADCLCAAEASVAAAVSDGEAKVGHVLREQKERYEAAMRDLGEQLSAAEAAREEAEEAARAATEMLEESVNSNAVVEAAVAKTRRVLSAEYEQQIEELIAEMTLQQERAVEEAHTAAVEATYQEVTAECEARVRRVRSEAIEETAAHAAREHGAAMNALRFDVQSQLERAAHEMAASEAAWAARLNSVEAQGDARTQSVEQALIEQLQRLREQVAVERVCTRTVLWDLHGAEVAMGRGVAAARFAGEASATERMQVAMEAAVAAAEDTARAEAAAQMRAGNDAAMAEALEAQRTRLAAENKAALREQRENLLKMAQAQFGETAMMDRAVALVRDSISKT